MTNSLSILDTQLTDERKSLAATSCDIERAANYCQDNFLKASNDKKLDNTMSYATQSFGTVSFHISRLASHFLAAIDRQNNIVAEIYDRLEKVKMFVDIHEEKVARKAIGSCTTQKVPIVFQHETVRSEPPLKFVRRPIDYSILDDIGHGIRTQDPSINQYGVPMMQTATSMVRRNSATNTNMFARQHHTISCRTAVPKTSLEYAATSVQGGGSLRYGSGTVGRTAGIYRTAVVPPQQFFGPTISSPPSGSVGDGPSPTSNTLPSNYASSSPGVPGSVFVPVGSDVSGPQYSGRSSGSSSIAGGPPTQQMIHHQQTVLRAPVHYAVNEHLSQQQQQASMGQFVLPKQQQQQVMMMQVPITSVEMNASNVATGHGSMLRQQEMHYQLARHQSLLPQQQQQCAPSQMAANTQQRYQRRQTTGYPAVSDASLHQNYAAQMQVAMPDNAPVQQYNSGQLQQAKANGNEVVSLKSQQTSSSSSQLIPRQPGDPAWAPEYYIEKVITLYEYTRDKDDELTFTENQIIYVVKKNDDGWWEGVMNGITGLFPGNYVELCDA